MTKSSCFRKHLW